MARRLASLLVAVACAGCGEEGPAGPGKGSRPPAPPRSWSSDDMVKDPQGYLAWADGQIAVQLEARTGFLGKLSERRADVKTRQQRAGADLTELENFQQRLGTALRRAEDEDRWPVKVGAKSYERARAQELLRQLPQQIELRRPLAQEYDAALASMDAKAVTVKGELEQLGRLRERIGLDLERVRLNQGAAELERLGSTAAEIEHFAKILGAISAEAAAEPVPAPPREGGLISLENLLK